MLGTCQKNYNYLCMLKKLINMRRSVRIVVDLVLMKSAINLFITSEQLLFSDSIVNIIGVLYIILLINPFRNICKNKRSFVYFIIFKESKTFINYLWTLIKEFQKNYLIIFVICNYNYRQTQILQCKAICNPQRYSCLVDPV